MSEIEEFDSILGFWFGKEQDAVRVNVEKSSLWWSKDAAIDGEIERRFGDLVEAAGWGDELEAWASTPRGMLALVILNDQFPRNIWRGKAQAFALDERSRKRADNALTAGMDGALRPIERVFLYLPFEHSESLDDQNRSLALYPSRIGFPDGECLPPAPGQGATTRNSRLLQGVATLSWGRQWVLYAGKTCSRWVHVDSLPKLRRRRSASSFSGSMISPGGITRLLPASAVFPIAMLS